MAQFDEKCVVGKYTRLQMNIKENENFSCDTFRSAWDQSYIDLKWKPNTTIY